MLANLKISWRIYGLVAVLLSISMGLSGFSILEMQSLGTEIEDIAERDMPLTEKLTKVTLHQLEQAVLFERSLALGQQLSSDPGKIGHFKELEQEFAELGHKVAEELKESEAVLAEAIEAAHSATDKAAFETILEILKKVDAEHKDYEQLAEQTLHLIETGELTHPGEIAEKIEHEQDQIDKELEHALELIETFTQSALIKLENDEHTAVNMLFIATAIALALGIFAAFFLARAVTVPIARMTTTMGTLAEGNNEVDVPSIGLTNEIGKMADAVQVFKDNAIENLRLQAEEEKAREENHKREEVERQREAKEVAARQERQNNIDGLTSGFGDTVEEILGVVAASSTQMESSAKSMSEIAKQTENESATVASAAEQATASVQTVASAAEELTSSIDEISRQVSHSSEISGKAVEAAEGTNKTIRELAEAAQKIGEVVDLINDIANQTNLLALNATIEAARAGDAGKGFAVVASEVKNLASQTAQATEDISAQIGGIQTTTQEAVSAIEGIGTTISEMNEIATTIASAVEEQGAATNEISRNVQEAASGTQEVSESIVTVKTGSEQTGEASGNVLSVSMELGERFQGLRTEVETFLKNIKAA
jgi:methyl-accepting chemotaxis protein